MILGFLGTWLVVFLATIAAGGEPQRLFNGENLEGWDGNPKLWSVEDGAITGRTEASAPIEKNTFLIWRGGELRDFRLRLEYRILGGNSGVQYRSRVADPKTWVVHGYQADIDSNPTYTGILYEEGGRGILTERGQRVTIGQDGVREANQVADRAELQQHVRNNDWNEYVIEAHGPRLRHTINGHLMSETADDDREHRADSGVLALQVHAGPPMCVQFRNIVLERQDSHEASAIPK
jgi:hypothetical protein